MLRAAISETALDHDNILRASSCATGPGKRHIPRVAATPASSSSKTGVAFLRKMLPVTSPWISRPGAAPHSFSALDDERRRVIAASPPLAARALQAPWRHGRLSAPSGHRSPWMCLRPCRRRHVSLFFFEPPSAGSAGPESRPRFFALYRIKADSADQTCIFRKTP